MGTLPGVQWPLGSWRRPLLRDMVSVCLAVMLSACGSTPAPTATLVPPMTATPGLPLVVSPSAASVTPTAMVPTPTTPATATPVPAAQVSAEATAVPAATSAVTATATATPPSPSPTVATKAAPPTVAPSTASMSLNGRTLSFSYPSGWHIKQQSTESSSIAFVEEANGALFSLTMYTTDMDTRRLADTTRDALVKQFSGAVAMPVTETVAGLPAVGYKLTFLHQTVPMAGVILAFKSATASFVLYTQAANADLGAVQPGFDLIKNTLVVK